MVYLHKIKVVENLICNVEGGRILNSTEQERHIAT